MFFINGISGRIICVFLLFFFSCSDADSTIREFSNDSSQENTVVPPPALLSNRSYLVSMESKSFSKVEINNKNKVTEQDMNLELYFNYNSDSNSNRRLTITYNSLRIKLRSDGDEEVLNAVAGGNSLDAMENVLGLLIGSSVQVYFDSLGNISSVNGDEELFQKLVKAIPYHNSVQKAKAMEMLNMFTGGGFIKGLVMRNSNIKPGTVLKSGMVWQRRDTLTQPVGLVMNVEDELDAIKGDKAYFETSGTVKVLKNAEGILAGNQVNVDIEGKESGEFIWEISSGRIISSFSKIKASGKLHTAGRSFPIEVRYSKKLTSKEIL